MNLLQTLLLLVSTGPAWCGAMDTLPVARFSRDGLSGWETQIFVRETDYRIVRKGHRQVLCAHSMRSASGLTRTIEVDLQKTPYLNWSWKVDRVSHGMDEQSKSGDDFAARIFVTSRPALFDTTHALSYVWSADIPLGSVWSSPFAGDRIRMIAARSGDTSAGNWIHEKRNVRKDFTGAFGLDIRYISGVALMTDSDNSQSEARACYGDIYFSAD